MQEHPKKGQIGKEGEKGNEAPLDHCGEARAKFSYGIRLLMEEDELVSETQLKGVESATLKELATNKLLRRQKDAGFTHSAMDFSVLGKLKEMEEVGVKEEGNEEESAW